MDPRQPARICDCAVDSSENALQWRLQRRCALTPNQFLLSYAILVAFSAAIALPFGWQGLWIIPLWCLVEICVAGAMYLFYIVHAADGEQISFSKDGALVIDVMRGLNTWHYRMNPAWARLERGGADKERLWLCCSALRVEVATQLASAQRRRVARELKQALASWQAAMAPQTHPPCHGNRELLLNS
ncbi:MAG: putative transrane protein [Polaromonas sp.]|nr:putative transrane protein [Polaromonas sp.]